MLLEQGIEQFEMWNSRRAPRHVMDEAVFKGIEKLKSWELNVIKFNQIKLWTKRIFNLTVNKTSQSNIKNENEHVNLFFIAAVFASKICFAAKFGRRMVQQIAVSFLIMASLLITQRSLVVGRSTEVILARDFQATKLVWNFPNSCSFRSNILRSDIETIAFVLQWIAILLSWLETLVCKFHGCVEALLQVPWILWKTSNNCTIATHSNISIQIQQLIPQKLIVQYGSH